MYGDEHKDLQKLQENIDNTVIVCVNQGIFPDKLYGKHLGGSTNRYVFTCVGTVKLGIL